MTFLKNFTYLFVFLFAFNACSDDEVAPIIVDASLPSGQFSVTRSGNLVAENGTPTMGSVELGSDEDGESFVRFGNSFTTELGTGTVSVYLSTSQTFMPDPANGNPNLRVIGSVDMNGEQFIKLGASPDSKFTHLILWCGTANIPFGYAALQ